MRGCSCHGRKIFHRAEHLLLCLPAGLLGQAVRAVGVPGLASVPGWTGPTRSGRAFSCWGARPGPQLYSRSEVSNLGVQSSSSVLSASQKSAFQGGPLQLRSWPVSMAMKVMSQVQHHLGRAAAGGLGENKLVRVDQEFLQQAAVKNGSVWACGAVPDT